MDADVHACMCMQTDIPSHLKQVKCLPRTSCSQWAHGSLSCVWRCRFGLSGFLVSLRRRRYCPSRQRSEMKTNRTKIVKNPTTSKRGTFRQRNIRTFGDTSQGTKYEKNRGREMKNVGSSRDTHDLTGHHATHAHSFGRTRLASVLKIHTGPADSRAHFIIMVQS